MKSRLRISSKWLGLLGAGVLCACTTQPSVLNRTIKEHGDPSSAINYVAMHVADGDYEITSGGTVPGDRSYTPTNWVSVVRVATAGNSIEILVPDDGTLADVVDAGLMTSEMQRDFERQFSLSMQLLRSFHDRPLPTVEANIRVVPPGVRYSERQLFKTNRLDHFVVSFVTTTDLLRKSPQQWFDSEIVMVEHELLHMNRWNKASFARQLTDPENETQAYFLSGCARLIARDDLPQKIFDFPVTLQDAVAPEDRDMRIDEIYIGMEEQHTVPTIIGFNTYFLAMHRYFVRLRDLGVAHPKAADAFALCQAVAHDQLDWADKHVDEKVYALAQTTAHLRAH
jgi:hypothetical protein